MPVLDLDALLAVEPQGAKRDVKDAKVGPHLPDIAHANSVDAKLVARIKRTLKAADEGDLIEAARQALKALDIAPEHYLSNQTMGLVLERMGRLSQSIDFYERAWKFNPADSGVYYNLGMVAWKLDMLEAAERFYRIALDLDPGSEEAVINLAGVLRDQAQFADCIEILRTAVYARPENPLFWNSLGTALLDAGDPEQAATFYHETLRLDPEFGRGWHNLGFAELLMGDAEASIAASDKSLPLSASPSDHAEMLYSRSTAALAAGRLEEGWRDYEVRLDKHYSSGTRFLIKAPRWDGGASVEGRRVLLIGEQGVGDEVLFLNVCLDLIEEIGPTGALTIACENRLTPLVARSFPGVRVVPHGTTRKEGCVYRGVPAVKAEDDIDVWAPMATPIGRYRRRIEDFPDRSAYLVPDPERVAAFTAALAELPPGPKVGLCWKSKLMNSKRTKYFSPFEDWKNVLTTPGATFVSLQYGAVDEEIAHAANEFGVTIHQIPDLDLMQDLEGVAALGAALDLSLGPLNASTNLSAAAGGEVWFIALKTNWPLLGTNRLPWYPRTRAFYPARYGDWRGVMGDIAAELAGYIDARAAA